MRSVLNAIVCSALAMGAASASPQGDYIELHACEVYTGGCTASAQATSGGRSLAKVWHFDQGSGSKLAGQSVAVLEVADRNLAFADAMAADAIVYLPEAATEAQRAALSRWVAGQGVKARVEKVVPLEFRKDGVEIFVKAGDAIQFRTRALEPCDSGSCGEQLWYEPKSAVGPYTVLVNAESRINEPLFQLSRVDHSSKSVFAGRFGSDAETEFRLAFAP